MAVVIRKFNFCVSVGHKFNAGKPCVFLTEIEIIPDREADCRTCEVIVEGAVCKNDYTLIPELLFKSFNNSNCIV